MKVIGSLYTRLRDKIEVKKRSELLYKIPCSCQKTYVGQTRQRMEKTLQQHSYDCRATNILKDKKTALAQHHFDSGHNFNFDKVEILDMESCSMKRNVSEMVFIYLNNTVNLKTDTSNLSNHYNRLLDIYKRNKNGQQL